MNLAKYKLIISRHQNFILKKSTSFISTNSSILFSDRKHFLNEVKSFKVTPVTDQFEKVFDISKAKVFELMSIYEEAIGIKEIKEAQQCVLEVIVD